MGGVFFAFSEKKRKARGFSTPIFFSRKAKSSAQIRLSDLARESLSSTRPSSLPSQKAQRFHPNGAALVLFSSSYGLTHKSESCTRPRLPQQPPLHYRNPHPPLCNLEVINRRRERFLLLHARSATPLSVPYADDRPLARQTDAGQLLPGASARLGGASRDVPRSTLVGAKPTSPASADTAGLRLFIHLRHENRLAFLLLLCRLQEGGGFREV